MKFLTILSLFCILFNPALAKKKESYWEHALNEVYEHASEASEKLAKVSSKAYEHVSKVVNSPEVTQTASAAYAGAASLGQKAVDVSSVAFEHVSKVVNSPEVTQAASAAYDTAASLGQKAVEASSAALEHVSNVITSPEVATAASDAYDTAASLTQKAAEASSTTFTRVNEAIRSGEAKTIAAQAASDAYAGAINVVDQLGKSVVELSKGRQTEESWTAYLTRVAPQLVYQKERVVAEGDKTDNTATESDDVVVEEVKKEKKPLMEYVYFWRDLSGASLKESVAHFTQRFYYGEDEDEKRAANLGYATAVNQIAGVFRQINSYGQPLYKRVSGWGWSMRQVNAAGGPAIYKPSLFGSTFSHFGSVFWYGSVVAETVNVVNAAAKDLDEGTSTNTVRASSKAVAGWTGASAGAYTGALLLSPIPFGGPLVGGVVGGVAGAYAGEMAGDYVANSYAAEQNEPHKEL